MWPLKFFKEHVEELGGVERNRTLQIPILVWALVFGSRLRRSQTPAGFQRIYNATADETIFPDGFYYRLRLSLADSLFGNLTKHVDRDTVN
jgi:putative transposase